MIDLKHKKKNKFFLYFITIMMVFELEKQAINVCEFFHDYSNSKIITGVYYSG
jgi:hypothetical protein